MYQGWQPLPASAQVAQLVEQRTENPRVGGSNPPLGTQFQGSRPSFSSILMFDVRKCEPNYYPESYFLHDLKTRHFLLERSINCEL